MQFLTLASTLALTVAALATPMDLSTESAASQNCDPVGCYPSTSFSILGGFKGDNMSGSIYYQGKKVDYKWTCNNQYHGFDSNLPYVLELMEAVGEDCFDEYRFVFVKYGAISAAMSNTPDCSQTGTYSYRCIFKANGQIGSGL